MLLALSSSVLPAQSDADVAVHVLNRTGFGPTPSLMAQLSSGPNDVDTYVSIQLAPPAGLPENARTTSLLNELSQIIPPAQGGAFPIGVSPARWLMLRTEVRAAYGDWQLNEVMTRFWNQHFNTSYGKLRFLWGQFQVPGDRYAAWFVKEDDDFYRANALGTFAQLLLHTAASESMLLYLDNHLNTATSSNENWARELVELYTMGEVNVSAATPTNPSINYTQADIIELARCFTGWQVAAVNPATTPPTFETVFDDTQHDAGSKQLFGGTPHRYRVLAGQTAFAEGKAVLMHLAGTEATKDFMCRKLMTLFLGDGSADKYPGLLAQAKSAWGSVGHIDQVLTQLLFSPEFRLQVDPADQWNRVKSPLRYNISMLRSGESHPSLIPGNSQNPGNIEVLQMFGTQIVIELMGQDVFSYPSPDGYPIENPRQISATGFVDRLASAERVIVEPGDPLAALQPADVTFYPVLHLVGQPNSVLLRPFAVADVLLGNHFGSKAINAVDRGLVAAEFTSGSLPTFDDVKRACEHIYSFTHFMVF